MPIMAGARPFYSQRNGRASRIGIGDVDLKDDSTLLTFISQRYSDRDPYRLELETGWYHQVAMYLGYHYHQYDRRSGRLIAPAPERWKVRLVANRLLGIVRKIVSKALRQRPHWVTLPATEDQEDLDVSVVATKLLRYYWRYLRMDRTLYDAFTWMGTCGNSFLSVVWDPDAGPELQVSEDDLKGLPEEFKNSRQKEIAEALAGSLHLGDLRIEVHSPFEMDPDPECLRLDNADYVTQSTIRSLTWLSDRYGKDAADLSPDADDSASMTRFYTRRIQHLAGSLAFGEITGSRDEREGVVCHTLWVNPTRKYPRGYWCVVAGGKVLEKHDELPNPFRRAPFVHLIEIPVPGRFWGTCALEQCIPLQMDYNSGRSKFIHNRNLHGGQKWINPTGSGVDKSQLNDSPDEVIGYNTGNKPERIDAPAMPEYLFRLLEYTLKDMEDISSIHEVTQSRAPSGVRSGVAIAQLQEADDQTLAPTFQVAEMELARLGSWALQLLAENIKEERLVRIVGESHTFESFQFTGKDLYGPNQNKPGVNYFDVEVQLGSQLPLSRQARAQYVIDLVNTGILDRERDGKLIREMLNIGATEEQVLQPDQLDRQTAKRESYAMTQGVAMDTNPFDDHMAHIDEHRKFQKQPGYQRNRSEQVDALFEEHIDKHAIAITPQGPPEPPGARPMEPMPEPQMPGAQASIETPEAMQAALAQLQAAGVALPNEFVDDDSVESSELGLLE